MNTKRFSFPCAYLCMGHVTKVLLLLSALALSTSCDKSGQAPSTPVDSASHDTVANDSASMNAPPSDSATEVAVVKDTVRRDSPVTRPPRPRPVPDAGHDHHTVVKKPVIYLYPAEEMAVNLKLNFKGAITVSYPLFEGEWTVNAQPNGELTDLRDGASLQYLYYEGEIEAQPAITSGFVVPREETISFLREKLSAIGLSPREYNDMITYWLPDLQRSPYNAIHFTLHEACDRYCELQVSPEPDAHIRVMMEFSGLDAPVALPAQELPAVKRQGFTLVEWGGVECNSLLP